MTKDEFQTKLKTEYAIKCSKKEQLGSFTHLLRNSGCNWAIVWDNVKMNTFVYFENGELILTQVAPDRTIILGKDLKKKGWI